MVPKIIHYCWFGGAEKSELVQKCLASWKKYCPDYSIIEWNEENWNVNYNQYTYEAFQEKVGVCLRCGPAGCRLPLRRTISRH